MPGLTHEQIVEIRDRHLPSQGESFNWTAFADDVTRAKRAADLAASDARLAAAFDRWYADHPPPALAGYPIVAREAYFAGFGDATRLWRDDLLEIEVSVSADAADAKPPGSLA